MNSNRNPLIPVLLFLVVGVLLGRPSTVEGVAGPGYRALLHPCRNRGLSGNAAGDGATDDAGALQETIETALELLVDEGSTPEDNDWDAMEVTIDLQGLTYRFESPLTINLTYTRTDPANEQALKTRLRIINGTLLSVLSQGSDDERPGRADYPDTPAIWIYPSDDGSGAYYEYPEVTFEHVRLQNKSGTSFTGIQIDRGLRCSFLNCAIEGRNTPEGSRGYARGIVLRGCQLCSFTDCHFSGNSNHVVFEQFEVDGTMTPNTDCRFYACTFVESTANSEYEDDRTDDFSGVGIVSKGTDSSGVTAAQCLFDGCSFESASDGDDDAISLVSLFDTRNMKFRACRFENATNDSSSTTVPLVQLGKVSGESTDARFIDCNFSGDRYADGYCIEGDEHVSGTALVANVFPSDESYAAISLSAGYSAVANTNLGDQVVVDTADVGDAAYVIDWTSKVHQLTTDATISTTTGFSFRYAADGRSITLLLEGDSEPDWTAADILWEEETEPTYSAPILYTFTQIGGLVYGSAKSFAAP